MKRSTAKPSAASTRAEPTAKLSSNMKLAPNRPSANGSRWAIRSVTSSRMNNATCDAMSAASNRRSRLGRRSVARACHRIRPSTYHAPTIRNAWITIGRIADHE